MKSTLMIWPLAAFLFVSLPVAYATDGGNVITSENKNIGDNKIPCKIITLQRPANTAPGGYVDLDAWVANNYGGDVAMPIHLIPNTSREISVKGSTGLLFKSLERESIVQNLLVDNGKILTLYQTPHDAESNPDGSAVFSRLLGISIPFAADTTLDAGDYIGSLEKRAPTDNNAN